MNRTNFSADIDDTAQLPNVEQGASSLGTIKGRVLAGGGLLVVAVIAGLVWWLVRHDDGTANAEPTPEPQIAETGKFEFTSVAEPAIADDCSSNSYGDAKEWFTQNPCERVARGLYTAEVDGQRALVSVVLVTMPEPQLAQQLKTVTDTEGTGNVNDLVKDGTVQLPGAPQVYKGEYASRVDGKSVTVVESDLFEGKKNQRLLSEINADAVRLAKDLR